MIRVRRYFYILLGIVHILRNQPRGMGVPNDYASVCLTQYAISMTMFKRKTDYGGPRPEGEGVQNWPKVDYAIIVICE